MRLFVHALENKIKKNYSRQIITCRDYMSKAHQEAARTIGEILKLSRKKFKKSQSKMRGTKKLFTF